MISICSTCTFRGGIFKITDGHICFICLDLMRHKAHYELDNIHELDIESIKKILIVTKKTEEVLLVNSNKKTNR